MPKKSLKEIILLDLKKTNKEMDDLTSTLSNLAAALKAHDDASQIKEIHKKLEELKLSEKASLLMHYLKALQKLDMQFFLMENNIISP